MATWCKELTHWKRPWCWKDWREKKRAAEDEMIASLTQCTWIWAIFGKQWRTEEPGVLQSMGSQTVGHDLVTKWQEEQIRTSWYVCYEMRLVGGKCSIQIMHVSHTFEIRSFEFSLHGVKQIIIIIMHILKVKNYILFSRLSEDSSWDISQISLRNCF